MDCPECGHRMTRLMPQIQQVHDICHRDGATGDSIAMPAFGKGVRVTSRNQVRDYQKRIPEELFNRTAGKHEVSFQDPRTGKMERTEIESKGIEIRDMHTSETKERPDLQKMAVDNMKREIKKELADGKIKWGKVNAS
jgi:hypothetical protein